MYVIFDKGLFHNEVIGSTTRVVLCRTILNSCKIEATLKPVRVRRAGVRVPLIAAVLGGVFAGVLGGISTAWAVGPQFIALPESGQTEMHIGRFHPVAAPLLDGQVLIAGAKAPRVSYEARNYSTPPTTLLPHCRNQAKPRWMSHVKAQSLRHYPTERC